MVGFFVLPFIAAQFVRGDFSTHFAVELGAEEGHAEAQFKRDPLIFRWKAWKRGIAGFESDMGSLSQFTHLFIVSSNFQTSD